MVLPEGDVDISTLPSTWSTPGIGSLRRAVRVSGQVPGEEARRGSVWSISEFLGGTERERKKVWGRCRLMGRWGLCPWVSKLKRYELVLDQN